MQKHTIKQNQLIKNWLVVQNLAQTLHKNNTTIT